MSWFYGDLPAQWLSARGFHLDVCRIYERYELAGARRDFGARPPTTPGAPVLFDMVAVECVPTGLVDVKAQGLRLLIGVDDDLWHGPPWDADPHRRARCEAWLRAADGIIVTSERLGARVQPFARGELVVIPPTLPPREAWPARRPRPRDRGLRIGWVGTTSHARDLDCIRPAVRELRAQRPDVTFVLGGQWVPDHPRVEIHSGWWLLPAYYRFVASLDLDGFVCPILDTPFNVAKPCLKPLEAAMLGLPVIASRVGSYAEDLVHEETALLVENTTEEWLAALTRLVEDAGLRAHLTARGLEWAATRTIDSTGPRWASLWGAG
jgi:glycosyltransferase involved in cell wall biosynthesis